MSQATFLLELGCEELPTSALKKAGVDLVKGIEAGLNAAGLNYSGVQGIASPRRLGVLIDQVDTAQPDKRVQQRGPSKAIGYKDGEPTPALLGFCRKLGIEPSELSEVETPKGTWLEYNGIRVGQATTDLLPALIKTAVDQLPLPKRMRWGATRDEFTRPVLWLVAMLDEQVLDLTLFDRAAGKQTRGHRVHSPEWIEIDDPKNYFELLKMNRVIADFDVRANEVRRLAQSLSTDDYQVVTDADLVDEVAALVEWPVPLMGQFSESFLDVPEEALVSSMKEHQKYFHVKHADGSLANRFVTMANLESKDPALVVVGNERVLNARLSDAKFFWDTDLKTPLASRADKMSNIVFHEKLGSLSDKTDRAAALAGQIATEFNADAETATTASRLAKCDLLSEMVLEFSDLQGLMGTYYARHEGYPDDIAEALVEVYKPAGANDDLPATAVGSTIAVADKLDTLVGMFAVDLPPTGSKDPFALRRAALGILRILRERKVNANLSEWIAASLETLASHRTNADAQTQVEQFFLDRLKVMLQGEGVGAEVFAAVTAKLDSLHLMDIVDRCVVLTDALGGDDLLAVAAGSKRVGNILAKADGEFSNVDPSLFEIGAEKELLDAVNQAESELTNAGFKEALGILSSLRQPIDGFFDQVMVNDERAEVRTNRLALLAQLQGLFADVADLSQLSS